MMEETIAKELGLTLCHVAIELRTYAKFCRLGDWLIVCDTVPVDGLEDVSRSFAKINGFEVLGLDRFGLSNHRGGWLRKL